MENALLLQKLSLTVRRKRRPYLEMPCLIDLLETSLKEKKKFLPCDSVLKERSCLQGYAFPCVVD